MSKKKKKGNNKSNKPQKPTTYIKQAARKLKVLECRATPEWSKSGITDIMVARQKPNGGVVVGHYIVDTFCLGLKNTRFQIFQHEFEYEDYLNFLMSRQEFEPMEPALAFNLIYGAIEFAEDHGFEPHKDFEITEHILPPVEDIEYIDIEFGKDGKPFYISGPYDNVEKIMGILNKHNKEGEFNFLAHIEPPAELLENINHETIDNFFPKEKIEKKMASLDEENRFIFQTYLDIAKVFLADCGGDLELLDTLTDDEPYSDHLLEIVLKKVNNDALVDHLNSEELEVLIARNASFVLEILLDNGNLEMLYKKGFMPIPLPLNAKEREGLSEQELQEHEEQLMKSFTEDERIEMFFTTVFLSMMAEDAENGMVIPKEAFLEDNYYISCVKRFVEKVPGFDEALMEGEEDFLLEYFESALETYWEDS